MRRLALLLSACILAMLARNSSAGPLDPVSGVCESRCDPLQVPPEPNTQEPRNIGGMLWDVFKGMAEATVETGPKFGWDEASPSMVAAKLGLGLVVPLLDNIFSPGERADPTEALQRKLDEDLVKMQDYLVCKMDSLIGKAKDDILRKMDSDSVDRMNKAVDGVMEWVRTKSCAWNCLNYTSVDPAHRSCASGITCVTAPEPATPQCGSVDSWDPWNPTPCQTAAGLRGQCSAIDKRCYITDTDWRDVQAQIRNVLDTVFLANSDLAMTIVTANGKAVDKVDLTDFSDILSLIGVSKAIMLHASLLQQLVFLGAADGSNAVLAQRAQDAVSWLEPRYNAYTSWDAARNTIMKFSTPMVFDANANTFDSINDVPQDPNSPPEFKNPSCGGWEDGVVRNGGDMPGMPQPAKDPKECCDRCRDRRECIAWTYSKSTLNCYLKSGDTQRAQASDFVNGIVIRDAGTWEMGMNYNGGDFEHAEAPSPHACADRCKGNPGCKRWTFNPDGNLCYQKRALSSPQPISYLISGRPRPERTDFTAQSMVPGRITMQTYYRRYWDDTTGNNRWQVYYPEFGPSPDGPANGYQNITKIYDYVNNCPGKVYEDVKAGRFPFPLSDVGSVSYPWGVGFDFFVQSVLRGSCEESPTWSQAYCTNTANGGPNGLPTQGLTVACGPYNGWDCLTSWTYDDGCLPQYFRHVANCAANTFYPQVSKAFNDMVTALQNNMVETLKPVKGIIDSLRIIANAGGLPVDSLGFYQHTYYPYLDCRPRNGSAPPPASTTPPTGSSGTCDLVVPAPPKPPRPTLLRSKREEPSAQASAPCQREPFLTLCPGDKCDQNGCTSCPSSAPMRVADSNGWFWTCATCAELGCAKGACDPSIGCTSCPEGSELLADYVSVKLAHSANRTLYHGCVSTSQRLDIPNPLIACAVGECASGLIAQA